MIEKGFKKLLVESHVTFNNLYWQLVGSARQIKCVCVAQPLIVVCIMVCNEINWFLGRSANTPPPPPQGSDSTFTVNLQVKLWRCNITTTKGKEERGTIISQMSYTIKQLRR